MTPLPVEAQDRRIKALYPDFRSVAVTDWIGIWEGELRPITQPYRIGILYFSRAVFDFGILTNPYVTVKVRDPAIGPDPRGTGEPPPHVYALGHPPAFPALCLYDPREDEWAPDHFVAETIIPWTVEWLYWFEVWLLTGEWRGGGRHPERRPSTPCQSTEDSNPESAAPQALRLPAEFNRLGRLTGTFASFPLMAAASAGSFPPRSWRNWSMPTLAAVLSESISTSLSEPPPAEFSPLASGRDTPPAISAISI